MSNLGNKEIMARNIRFYMDKYQKSRNDMCEALGVKYTTFTDWVKGNSYPRIDKIELMANYFGITKADLVEEHVDTPSDLYNIQCSTQEECDLLRSYRDLNTENQVKCRAYTQNLLSTQRMEDELLAAHTRTNVKATPEDIQHDIDIMDDDSKWD